MTVHTQGDGLEMMQVTLLRTLAFFPWSKCTSCHQQRHV